MSQNYDLGPQQVTSSVSSPGKRFYHGKIKWLSFVTCLLLLLITALALMQGALGNTQGAHAAQPKHYVSSPKHPHAFPHVGKSKPVLNVSSLSLNFSASVGSTVRSFQTVSVKDTGVRDLYWRASISPSTATWLTTSALKALPPGMRTSSGRPTILKIYVDVKKLVAGTYTGQILLTGTDQQGKPVSGSPQTIVVTLKVS